MISFSCGPHVGFAFNRNTVFLKSRDKRKVTALFTAKSASFPELNAESADVEDETRYLVDDSSTARLKTKFVIYSTKFLEISCELHGKSARKLPPRRIKNCETGRFTLGGTIMVIPDRLYFVKYCMCVVECT